MIRNRHLLFYFLILCLFSCKDKDIRSDFFGDEARDHLEAGLGLPIPEDAVDLFFSVDRGFLDSVAYGGISLPPDKAWPLIKKFAGCVKEDFEPWESLDGSTEDPRHVLYWNPAVMDDVFSVTVDRREEGHMLIVYYSDKEQRLLFCLAGL